MQIRSYQAGDQEEWVRMRHELWPKKALEQHVKEMRSALSRPKEVVVLVCPRTDGSLAGFIHLDVKGPAPGASGHTVCSIEAIYVDPDVRRMGIGRTLMNTAEGWAVELGCTELVSGVDSGDLELRKAHAALGFKEVGYTVHFHKSVTPH